MQRKNIFATRWGIIGVGAFIGILAPVLQKLGNSGNMGICVACFERDIAGAVGFHQAKVVQYIRPEIIGFILGALIAAYLFKEEGKGYKGRRLFLTKIKEETDKALIDSLRRRRYDELKDRNEYLVYFHIDKVLPLIGPGDE